jgi:hypothetical protein
MDRTGRWPSAGSGPIAEAPGEKWNADNMALVKGNRGLPGGSSLARLLGEMKQKEEGKIVDPPSETG